MFVIYISTGSGFCVLFVKKTCNGGLEVRMTIKTRYIIVSRNAYKNVMLLCTCIVSNKFTT